MTHKKFTKKDSSPRVKDNVSDVNHHGKQTDLKVKYNHKNHWLDEDADEEVPQKIKKKKKTE